jgi:hypothetical protein
VAPAYRGRRRAARFLIELGQFELRGIVGLSASWAWPTNGRRRVEMPTPQWSARDSKTVGVVTRHIGHDRNNPAGSTKRRPVLA